MANIRLITWMPGRVGPITNALRALNNHQWHETYAGLGFGSREEGVLKRITGNNPQAREFQQKALALAACDRCDLMIGTFDWTDVLFYIIHAYNVHNKITVLVPHEAVFASESEYYAGTIPITDVALVWGEVQKNIFVNRGYPENRIITVGTPKFDPLFNFKPQRSWETLSKEFGLSPQLPTILFITQPLDYQFPAETLDIQIQAIIDTLRWAEAHGAQLLVRLTPDRSADILGPAVAAIQESHHAAIDGLEDGGSRRLTPHESIYYCDAVVGFNSTMHLEAAMMNKPCLSIMYNKYSALWVERGGIPSVTSASELGVVLERFLSKRGHSFSPEGWRWATNCFLGGWNDGRSAERIGIVLDILAQANKQNVHEALAQAEIILEREYPRLA